ncbi:uncharacterized protein LOC111694710 [Eurytemora carolleeae]|uniref:uncharacterized protein LOC111694710 n=1 Tax=Eurytemora carolleeae TaxID=1294199 RepID=UPI000C763966|nr:uncharacterized protein LOC111694710 [Eurytemora carolleeae]|eukprot:XP_023319467.1 uncharacterized protein LOC111694710 [Eurytemora affinis]
MKNNSSLTEPDKLGSRSPWDVSLIFTPEMKVYCAVLFILFLVTFLLVVAVVLCVKSCLAQRGFGAECFGIAKYDFTCQHICSELSYFSETLKSANTPWFRTKDGLCGKEFCRSLDCSCWNISFKKVVDCNCDYGDPYCGNWNCFCIQLKIRRFGCQTNEVAIA